MGHSGSEAEQLVDQTDFACRSCRLEDAVTATDHAHNLDTLQGSVDCSHSLEGIVMSGWRPFGNVIVDDVWA
jgi:hypothetical protein